MLLSLQHYKSKGFLMALLLLIIILGILFGCVCFTIFGGTYGRYGGFGLGGALLLILILLIISRRI